MSYMTDKRTNKVSGQEKGTVRLPDELHVALRREAAAALDRGEKPPAFGDLLLQAWTTYRRVGRQVGTEDGGECISISGLSPEERAEVRTYIDQLRSGQTLTSIKCPKSLRPLVLTLVQVAETHYENKIAEAAKRHVLETLEMFASEQPK